MSEDPIGKLVLHKDRFYIMRVDGWLPGCEEWLSGRDPDGHRHTAKASEFMRLSDEDARKIAPMFHTAKVIQGPWKKRA